MNPFGIRAFGFTDRKDTYMNIKSTGKKLILIIGKVNSCIVTESIHYSFKIFRSSGGEIISFSGHEHHFMEIFTGLFALDFHTDALSLGKAGIIACF